MLYRICGAMFLLLALLASSTNSVHSQDIIPRQGDPPTASRIRLETDASRNRVTITGERNAVFPAADVVVRNLYSGETLTTRAGITGSFVLQIAGVAGTPFWISPVSQLSADSGLSTLPMPGGPGTIVVAPQPTDLPSGSPVTQIQLDATADDWLNYASARQHELLSLLRNGDALYLLLRDVDPAQVVDIEIGDGSAIAVLRLNPSHSDAVSVRSLAPVPGDARAVRAVLAHETSSRTLEARILLTELPLNTSQLRLRRVSGLSAEDLVFDPSSPIAIVDEREGIVVPSAIVDAPGVEFAAGGRMQAYTWHARGRVNQQSFAPGDDLIVELDFAAAIPAQAVPDGFAAELTLTPVSVPSRYSNNGWSNLLTPTGLAVNNVLAEIPVATAEVLYPQLAVRSGESLGRFQIMGEISADLPPGLYVPVLRGYSLQGDEYIPWEDLPARLNVVLSVAGGSVTRLPWALFYDNPSNGRRGLLPLQDQTQWALSGRVRFDAGSYILPPGSYPLEPYLPNILPNLYGDFAEPLVPFAFPSGTLQATVTYPDGTVDELPAVEFAQNRLSSALADDALLFGTNGPINVYRLTSLQPAYTSYNFEQYGDYQIELTGIITDIFGNRYEGGGTYNLTIAEPLNLMTGMLSGMPLSIADRPFLGGRVQPQVPADIITRFKVIGLDGLPVSDQTERLKADRFGYFEPVQSSVPIAVSGEYLLLTEARYTDEQGRLWAASVPSAGVITDQEGAYVAHGRRGMAAWYLAGEGSTQLHIPYYSGDLIVLADRPQSIVQTSLTIQAFDDAYAGWLASSDTIVNLAEAQRDNALPLWTVGSGESVVQAPALFAPTLVNQAYSYISVVQPGVSIRQFVLGGEDPALPLLFSAEDPLNGQLGAGRFGLARGDYAFVFGGGVIRNAEADVYATAAYAAGLTVGSAQALEGVFPPYRGASGGADGGSVLSLAEADEAILFLPTALMPGQVIAQGSRVPVVGNALPTLAAEVTLDILTPDGRRIVLVGDTNAIGYLYDPEFAIDFDVAGVWQITLRIEGKGVTSVGPLDSIAVVGSVPGASEQSFQVYVVDTNSQSIEWGQRVNDVDRTLRAGNPINFEMLIPEGWTDVSAYYLLATPSYLIAQGSLRVGAVVALFQYDPAEIQRIIPAYEVAADASGPAAADPVTLTFAMLGTDREGQRQINTRTFTLFHDRLMSIEAD